MNLQKQSYVRIIMGLSIFSSVPSAVEDPVKTIISGVTTSLTHELPEAPMPSAIAVTLPSAIAVTLPSAIAVTLPSAIAVTLPSAIAVTVPSAIAVTESSTLAGEVSPLTSKTAQARSLTPTSMIRIGMSAISALTTRTPKLKEYCINEATECEGIVDIRKADFGLDIHMMRAVLKQPTKQVEDVPFSALRLFPLAALLSRQMQKDPRIMAYCLVNCPGILVEGMFTIYLVDKVEGTVRTSGLTYKSEDSLRSKESILKAHKMAKETTSLFQAPVINYEVLKKYLKENPQAQDTYLKEDPKYIEADGSMILPNSHFIVMSVSSFLDQWVVLMHAEEQTQALVLKAVNSEAMMLVANIEVARLSERERELELALEEVMTRAEHAAVKLEEEYAAGKKSLTSAKGIEVKVEGDIAHEEQAFNDMADILNELAVLMDNPQGKNQQLKELVAKFNDKKTEIASAGKALDGDSKALLKCLEEVFEHVAAADGILSSSLHFLRAGFGLFVSVFSIFGLRKAIVDSVPRSVSRRLFLLDSTKRNTEVALLMLNNG